MDTMTSEDPLSMKDDKGGKLRGDLEFRRDIFESRSSVKTTIDILKRELGSKSLQILTN